MRCSLIPFAALNLFFTAALWAGLSMDSLAGVFYGGGSYGAGWYGYGRANIIASTNSMILPEGTSIQLTLRLDTKPPANQTVNLSRFSGDSDISISGNSSLVFSTSNWNQSQTFTLLAASDSDSVNGTAVVRCAAAEMTNSDINVTESDRTGPDDTDRDGRINSEEYIAGTNWLNPLSAFQNSVTRQGSNITISFNALATTAEYGGQVRHYKLETTTDLAGNLWTAVSGASDITSYGTYQYSASIGGVPRFYRTKVWLTP